MSYIEFVRRHRLEVNSYLYACVQRHYATCKMAVET